MVHMAEQDKRRDCLAVPRLTEDDEPRRRAIPLCRDVPQRQHAASELDAWLSLIFDLKIHSFLGVLLKGGSLAHHLVELNVPTPDYGRTQFRPPIFYELRSQLWRSGLDHCLAGIKPSAEEGLTDGCGGRPEDRGS